MLTVVWILLVYLTAFKWKQSVGFNIDHQGATQEYCPWENFNVTCAEDEVILMKSADYGRMQLGRCVSKNYGYVSCKADMLHHVDSLCSGRRSCKFVVPTDIMRTRKPCPKDFSSYLKASYICVKVETSEAAGTDSAPACDPGSYRTPHELNVSSTSGYLSSLLAAEEGYGSESCPWIIRADQGQRINVTLLDFSLGELVPGNEINPKLHARTFCNKYAVIREKVAVRETVVCGGDKREENVFISNQNTVEIQLMRYNIPKKAVFFLLKFEAIGCPVFVPPRDGVVEQIGNSIIVTCNHTRQRSYLRCNGKTWVGELRNCSPSDEDGETYWTVIGDDWSSPFGILIVTAMGVALGLVIGVIMLTSVLFCLKRRNRCLARRSEYAASPQESEDEERDDYTTPYCKRNSAAGLVDQVELVNLNNDGNYGAVWKSRPPSYSPATGHQQQQQQQSVATVASERPDRVEPPPPPPPPPQPRNMQNLINTDMASSNAPPAAVSIPAAPPKPPAPPSSLSAKLAALTSFRPQEVHVYESPKFVRRDGESVPTVTGAHREVS